MKRKKSPFYLIQGEEFTSVTTILSAISKPALIGWAAKISAEYMATHGCSPEVAAAQIHAVKDAAADKGTAVHKYAERVMQDLPVDMDKVEPELKPYIEALLKFHASVEMKPFFTEIIVYNPEHGYAGRCDMIAQDKNGEFWALDWKSGRHVYAESGLQLIAYAQCGMYTDGVSHDPLPRIQHTAVVHLKSDGSFSFVEFHENISDFLAVKKVYEWQHRKG
jgi:hypothetical protein